MERCPPDLLPGAAPQHNALLQRALAGLTLDDEPFAQLGAPLALRGEAVIDLLQHHVTRGLLLRIGLVFADVPDAPANDEFGLALIDASASGLPLLHKPYEALGAMLGVPARQVQARLAEWLAQGRLLRIAAVLAPPAVPTQCL